MKNLGEKFGTSQIVDKLVSTETEVEKDIINNIENFKKLVTADEISIEEKYKNPYIYKPFCKLIFGTNNLPQIKIDDEGFFRRICIIPFNKKFSKEEVQKFDKSNILTQGAIDYLANIALNEYLIIADKKVLANDKENNEFVDQYRKANNSSQAFLKSTIIDEIFAEDNIIPKTVFYGKYVEWCNKNKFFIKKKADFYEEVLSLQEYREGKGKGGYDCFINTKKKNKAQLPKPMKF